jgi:hypothetical protein
MILSPGPKQCSNIPHASPLRWALPCVAGPVDALGTGYCSPVHEGEKIMIRLFGILALGAGLAGCVVAPPYGYGYGDPAYGYGPGYYAPRTSIGVGVGGGSFGGGVGVGVGLGF